MNQSTKKQIKSADDQEVKIKIVSWGILFILMILSLLLSLY